MRRAAARSAEAYEAKEAEVTPEIMRMVESRYIMLPIIDRLWVDHLYVMDASRPASACAATVKKIRASSTKKKPTRSSKSLKNNIADEAIQGRVPREDRARAAAARAHRTRRAARSSSRFHRGR